MQAYEWVLVALLCVAVFGLVVLAQAAITGVWL